MRSSAPLRATRLPHPFSAVALARRAPLPLASLLAALVVGPPGSATQGPPEEAPPPPVLDLVLEVHGPDGWRVVEREGVDAAPFLLPRITRSERVERFAVDRRGLVLRLSCAPGGRGAIDALDVHAVEHATDEQVLLLDGVLSVVGPPVLPVSADRDGAGGAALVGALARHDASGVEGGAVFLGPPVDEAADALVLLGAETPAGHAGWEIGYAVASPAGGWQEGFQARLPGRTRHAAVLPAPVRGLRLDLGAARLDQAVYARTDAVGAAARVPLELRATRVHGVERTGTRRRGGLGPSLPVFTEVAGDGRAHLDPAAANTRVAETDGLLLELSGGEAVELVLAAPPEPAEGRTTTLVVRVVLPESPAAPPERSPSEDRPAAEPPTDRAAAPGAEPDGAAELFVDATAAAGIDFVHLEGPDEQLDIRPTMGPGAAWGDVDGDGWVDLYLVQGGGRAGSRVEGNRLYRNRGDGTFEDVSASAGCADTGAGMAAQFLDVDGDGDLDLYVANQGPDALYRNDGTGRFELVTRSGVPQDDAWSAGVCAGDVDGDGDLDLYVTRYLRYDEEAMPAAEDLPQYRREDPIAMLPFAFPGERNVFLRNGTGEPDAAAGPAAAEAPAPEAPVAPDAAVEEAADVPAEPRAQEAGAPREDAPGDRAEREGAEREGGDAGAPRFVDATDELGLADAAGRGMQPVLWDFDRDGDLDLYVANDVSFNVLWRNEGDGTFRDISFMTGMDDPRGGMGVAVGDVEEDGDLDLFLTNWQLEPNALYVNNLLSHTSARHRVATFRDRIVEAGLGAAGVGATSWGVELLDADLDGDLDLYVANGYTSPDYESTGICVGQRDHLFENDGAGRFRDAHDRAPRALAVALPSRAAVACDYDRDGDLDLLVTANNGPVRLLRNTAADRPAAERGAWLGVRLRGAGANRFGVGAEVTVRAGERVLRRSLLAGTSYLGGNPPELHFGLGDARAIEEVVVRWPSGAESRHSALGVDRWVELAEPR